MFPNWETCEVTGQGAGGYGGTLECVLFGPLQPVGANGGASAAPTITLAATVNPSSTASVVTNVAVVDYHTFGNPDDAGRDSDDATVTLSALPVTGGGEVLPLLVLALLALLGGITAVMSRRRRAEAHPDALSVGSAGRGQRPPRTPVPHGAASRERFRYSSVRRARALAINAASTASSPAADSR